MRALTAGFIALVLATVAAASAFGATFTVNSTDDTTDGACGASAGGCTLREAIEAVVALPGRDTIRFDPTTFPPGIPTVIGVTAALPAVGDAAGTAIDGSGAGVVIFGSPPVGDETVPLRFESGPGVPLAKVTVVNVSIVGFAGPAIVVCGGVFPACDEDVSGTVVQHVVATRNLAGGILVRGRDVTKTRIVASVVEESSLAGIELDASGSLAATRIERCTVHRNGHDDEGPGISLHAGVDTTGTVITDTIAVENAAAGILIVSDRRTSKTKLTNVTAVDNGEEGGIAVRGDAVTATSITNAVASHNGGAGVIVAGNTVSSTTMKDIVAIANLAGIGIGGDVVTGGKITNATAANNPFLGIAISAPRGGGVAITGARVSGNGFGLVIGGSGNVVKRVRADRNGAGILLEAPGSGNTIERCTAHFNNGVQGGAGITVAAGNTGNVLRKNAAHFNDGDNFDDGNPNCDGNVWKDNVFVQVSDPCIQ